MIKLSPFENLIAGPAVNYRMGRKGKNVESDTVAALGDLGDALEAGGFAGVRFGSLLNSGDSVELSAKVLFDVTGKHDGRIIDTTIQYETPVGTRFFIGLEVTGTYGDDNYHDFYFRVTPEGAALSGLDAYDPGDGWSEVRGAATLRYHLSRDWAVIGIGSHGRMLDQAKRSPIVKEEGGVDQLFGGLGVVYTF